MSAGQISTVVLLLTVFGCGAGSAQSSSRIRVRLVNAHTGKALENTPVSVTSLAGTTVWGSKTDSDGIAVIDFGADAPAKIRISEWDWDRCSSAEFSTKEVLRKGQVSPNRCDSHNLTFSQTSRPGEVVLFVPALTWWQKAKLAWYDVFRGH